MEKENRFGNIKVKLKSNWTFGNENYKKGKKYIALKSNKYIFLSLGGRFYFLLPDNEYEEISDN